MFADRVKRGGDKLALHVKRAGRFEGVTWNQLASNVRRAAAALRHLGVLPGHRVVQVSENRYEWIVTDFAVHMARGVHVAVHAALAGPQIIYQIADSGARLVLVSGPEQLEKIVSASGALQGRQSCLMIPAEMAPPAFR